MISLMINEEHVGVEDLNSMMDKSSNVVINGCDIDSGGYISNIKAKVLVTNSKFSDTNLVLKDDSENKLQYNFHDKCGVRLVSVVCGYAYTHQVVCHRSFGIGIN